MSTSLTAVLTLPEPRESPAEDRHALQRFAAIVRALASLAAARPPAAAAGEPVAADDDAELPTRRLNRLRRMFGRLRRRPMQGGKSRRHTR
jgi:hypothetical protein